ncbi:putative two-component hybrid sensor and regulator [Gemmatimonas aurantiaca T-27]|uniref:histidine kinase n=2 Tax=Gemmatimonas aurantiaca TaxID=173480 RepID=C1A3V9_GEMAT|nr:putative two-component hybrid sensor and regulator [Gemmatimonas aurantiaca T-27]
MCPWCSGELGAAPLASPAMASPSNRFVPKPFRAGIRRRLFLLALSLTLPIALISLVRAVERWRSEQELLAERSLATARRAAQLFDADVNAVHTILASVSRLLRIEDPPERNDSLLRHVFDETSINLTNVFITDTLGDIHGSLRRAAMGPALPNMANTEPFQEVMRTRRYAVGRARRSVVLADTGWVLPLTMPILSENSARPLGIAGASIAVDSLAAIRLVRDLPEGSVLTVLTSGGDVLLRSAELDTWLKQSPGDSSMMALDFAHPDAVQEVKSLDGTNRLVAHAPLASTDGLLYIGIPVSATLEVARRQFLLDLFIGLMGTLVFIGFALFTARRITDPLLALSEVAGDLAAGDRDRRANVRSGDEIEALAHSLNRLADTVSDRERALEASEARYRHLFSTSPLPMLTWRLTDGRIEQANDAAGVFVGASEVGADTRVLDLIVEDERDAFAELPLPDVASTMRAGTWTLRDRWGGRRQVELFVGAIEREHETVAVGIMIDVTERRRAEAELEQSREQLRQAQKLEALGAFAGGIAHDFNNYLSAIATNAELLRDELPLLSSHRLEASEILGAAQRASALTRQILVFSRRQVVHDERLDVNSAIHALRRLLSRLVGEQIEVRITVAPDAPRVMFDHGRLEQVLMNLAANARDAMPAGGCLTISTERTTAGDLRLRVSDSGAGIPPEVLPRVFEPFYTTKTRERGTGLGLAMVYSIVTAARGEIVVTSDVGQGTEIVITFPGIADVETPHEVNPVASDPSGGTEHILLVEDDGAVRKATTSLLTRAGYRVTAADSAFAAWELLEAMPEPPDMVLSDVVMPQVSGPEFAARVAVQYPTIPVLFMSGYADDDAVMQGIASNSLHFVAKPFSAGQLLGAVRRLLDEVRSA